MVNRSTKLIAAALVLAAGIGLAWPFRRQEKESIKPPSPVRESVSAKIDVAAAPIAPPASVAASFAADTTSKEPVAIGSQDAKTAPAEAPPVAVVPIEPTPPEDSVAEPLGEPEERIHIVHDGDSLERLAKRYLGDESRALEIFDLNRGTLENPHWLPIGAELRLPPRERSADLSG
jgi:nucleoid-associated protein YgaU